MPAICRPALDRVEGPPWPDQQSIQCTTYEAAADHESGWGTSFLLERPLEPRRLRVMRPTFLERQARNNTAGTRRRLAWVWGAEAAPFSGGAGPDWPARWRRRVVKLMRLEAERRRVGAPKQKDPGQDGRPGQPARPLVGSGTCLIRPGAGPAGLIGPLAARPCQVISFWPGSCQSQGAISW
jgi:hypothetical protein